MSGPAPADATPEAPSGAPSTDERPSDAPAASDADAGAKESSEAAEQPSSDKASSEASWQTFKAYLALFDFARTPDTKVGWLIRIGITAVVVVVLFRRTAIATMPLLSAKPPPPIPTEEVEDYRFRLPERTRHEIFTELATAELAERERATKANTWNGHLWSREDDRGHYERVAVRAVAHKYRVSFSQVYLVLDEGIRNHWLAPDGKPLPATTPPLSIRSNSW